MSCFADWLVLRCFFVVLLLCCFCLGLFCFLALLVCVFFLGGGGGAGTSDGKLSFLGSEMDCGLSFWLPEKDKNGYPQKKRPKWIKPAQKGGFVL